jgi:hypothetical protein
MVVTEIPGCLFCPPLLLEPLSSISINLVDKMFTSDTLKTKLTFRRQRGGSASRVKSPADTEPVIDSNSPAFNDETPPSSSTTRKHRFFSNITHFKKMSLASIFKKDPVSSLSMLYAAIDSLVSSRSKYLPQCCIVQLLTFQTHPDISWLFLKMVSYILSCLRQLNIARAAQNLSSYRLPTTTLQIRRI